ncbi:MAG: LysR substrate-binding domain-containing protein [Bacteroidia bacterium]|jgi:LysR family hydrogen peroxide-inducible transcriptional activator|nr:LysR substrate-binding domain-containing protein [Bacteroidia bacterium]
MNLQQFQYILAVAEYKHFELAAEKCFITQSTLSTMISKFEDEIGIKIFDRKKKPVQVTLEGSLVIQHLKLITNQIEQLKEVTKEIKGETGGNLSLSVIPTIAPFLLPMFLQEFAGRFPNLNITVREETTAEIQRKLKNRELDIGIISIPLNDKDLSETKLYDEPFLYFDAEKVSEKNVPVKKIRFEKFFLMEEGHCMRTQALQFCNRNQQQSKSGLNFEYKAGSIDGLLRFVKANRGATLVPYLATLQFSSQDKKHLFNFAATAPYRTVGLVVHQHFVKKKLLGILQQCIMDKVADILPQLSRKSSMLLPV